jgi:hypothetical protein
MTRKKGKMATEKFDNTLKGGGSGSGRYGLWGQGVFGIKTRRGLKGC